MKLRTIVFPVTRIAVFNMAHSATMMLLIQLSLFCHAMTATTSTSTTPILDFWHEQDDAFQLDEPEEVVLMMGNTGSGITISTLLLTGAPLESKEDCFRCESYHIHDPNGYIGTAFSESKTLTPQPYYDKESNVLYYDCPGFNHIGSPEHDISTALLINKLLKRAKSFKIALVVNQLSVTKGEDTSQFRKFIDNVAKLFKNINTYKDGIAMVVTKVENTATGDDEEPTPVDDATIIMDIAYYLQAEKTWTQNQILNNNSSLNQSNYDSEKLKLLDVLLQKNDLIESSFDRIGIFRKPVETGLLSTMPLIQEGRRNMKKIIEKNLRYVGQNKSAEFGLVISPESQVHIRKLFRQFMSVELLSDISSICRGMKQYFGSMFEENQDFHHFKSVLFEGHQLLNGIQSDDALSYVMVLINETEGMNVDSSVGLARKHVEYITFLQTVEYQNLSTPDTFIQEIDGVKAYVKLQYDFHVDGWVKTLLNETMLSIIGDVSREIQESYIRIEDHTTDIYVLRGKLSTLRVGLSKVDITKPQSLLTPINKFGIRVFEYFLNKLKVLIREMEYAPEIVIKNKALMKSSKTKFAKMFRHLEQTVLWYEYLIKIYSDLSSPDHGTQEKKKEVVQALIQSCDNFSIVRKSDFEQLSDFVPGNNDALASLENLELTWKKKNALKALLTNVIEEPTVLCQNNSLMTVTGTIIRMSDIASDKTCFRNATFVEIFASELVIIDTSVEKHGNQLQMAIMSPMWIVFGTQTIILQGDEGKSKADAEDSPQSSSKGHDGEAGYPGGQGGNFFGIGQLFRNGKNLMVLSKGGKGGPGQRGGKGPSGFDGSQPTHADNYQKAIRDCYSIAYPDSLPRLTKFFDSNGYWFKMKYDGYYIIIDNWKRGDKNGTDGGPGGDGGASGLGGNAGIIKIIELDRLSLISRRQQNGDLGVVGQGGPGGDKAVSSFVLGSVVHVVPDGVPHYNIYFAQTHVFPDTWTKNGPSGRDGLSSENREFPTPAREYNSMAKSLENFRNYLHLVSKDSFRKSEIRKFISVLEILH